MWDWFRRPSQGAFVALFALTFFSCGPKGNEAAGPGAFPPPEVGVVSVQAVEVPLTRELVGRLEATRTSEVRAQVEGIVVKRFFREGSDVKAGARLFEVDRRPYEADLAAAKAALAQAEAESERAAQQVARYKPLVEERAISPLEFESAIADLKEAEASVASAVAQIKRAELNLGYAHISAPISGRIGRALVTEGALVGRGEPSHVATIEQIDPIYVNFTQSSAELLRLKKAVEDGTVKEMGKDQARVQLLLEDGEPYASAGTFDFSDLKVDPNTGVVHLRASFPNPKRELLPGMFVKVRFQEGVNQNAFLVPQAAVQIGPQGSYVMTLGADGLVAVAPVKTAGMYGMDWVITEGLESGTQVIADGLQKVRPGAPAKAVPFVPVGAPAKEKDSPATPAAEKAAPAAESAGEPQPSESTPSR